MSGAGYDPGTDILIDPGFLLGLETAGASDMMKSFPRYVKFREAAGCMVIYGKSCRKASSI